MNGETTIKINHSVETEEGNFVFQGEFQGKELEFLVEFAVNELLMRGALPFVSDESEEYANLVMPEATTEQ